MNYELAIIKPLISFELNSGVFVSNMAEYFLKRSQFAGSETI